MVVEPKKIEPEIMPPLPSREPTQTPEEIPQFTEEPEKFTPVPYGNNLT